jgi:ABC-type bacteriocin/lantibiotic exporter with double-glycine peptidase domain
MERQYTAEGWGIIPPPPVGLPRSGGGEPPIGHVDAIAVRDLSKRYATRDGAVAALEGISFGVGEGEFVAVVGPSGCG